MTQGMKVTKAGKAIDSAVLDDFYLHTGYPLLKVHSYGTFSNPIRGVKYIYHDLGYKPFALVFSQYVGVDGEGNPVLTDEYYQHDWEQHGASHTFWGSTHITASYLAIQVGNTDNPWENVSGIYYIFKDEVI